MIHCDFGVTQDEFRSQHFETAPYLRRRCFDSSKYSWKAIDRALDRHDSSFEMFKVVRGERIAPEVYSEEHVDVGLRRRRILRSRLYALISRGATLVLNRAELVSEPMRDLCMAVGRLVGTSTTGNAYATLGIEPATNPHWDTHDVFVMQMVGRKAWKLYQPTFSLPMVHQVSNHRKAELPSKAVMEFELEAGDALYVPRGWWHQVTPVSGSDTIHLTVAIHAPILLDYLIWACSSEFPNHLEFRKGIINSDFPLEGALNILCEKLTQPALMKAFYEKYRSKERVNTPFDIEGLLKATTNLSNESRIQINSRSMTAATADVLVDGSKVTLSPEENSLVRLVASEIDMSFKAIKSSFSGVPDEQLSQMLRKLALEDVIRIVA